MIMIIGREDGLWRSTSKYLVRWSDPRMEHEERSRKDGTNETKTLKHLIERQLRARRELPTSSWILV
jgi:hypothetical protein